MRAQLFAPASVSPFRRIPQAPDHSPGPPGRRPPPRPPFLPLSQGLAPLPPRTCPPRGKSHGREGRPPSALLPAPSTLPFPAELDRRLLQRIRQRSFHHCI